MPQSEQTQNEIKMLAAVSTQIISPRESKPIVSVVQDVALGIYRITKDDVRVSEKQLFNLMMSNSKFTGIVPEPHDNINNVKTWSGKQLLSGVIPPTVNISMGNDQYDGDKTGEEKLIEDKKNFVKVERGIITQGTFDKTIYQAKTKGLVHSVYNENGQEDTRDLFNNTQKLICDWLVLSGFSVGVSDLIISQDTKEKMTSKISKMKEEVYNLMRQIHEGTFKNESVKTNNDYFEQEVNKFLNEANSAVGNIGLKNIGDENRMINMVKSKSKGNAINIAQMISSLGQQNVDGKRILYGFDDRTLPHYTKYDDGPEARGFVESSFIDGLNPNEFFLHAITGREGLIDTAVKTSEVGYIQRKLVKAMEDCKINYDFTVRNAGGSIIQFLYGEDAMSSIKLEDQKINYIDMNKSEVERKYLLTVEDIKLQGVVRKELFKVLNKDNKWEQKCIDFYKRILEDRNYFIEKIFKMKYETKVIYPVSLYRIIMNTKQLFHPIPTASDLHPCDIIDTLEELENELAFGEFNKGTKMFGMLLRSYLSPKQCIFDHKFSKISFEYIIQQIKLRFKQAIANPSEMVGVIAAQSIGEPTTQLTLNSVEWNTEMILKINGNIKKCKIGEWIDNRIEKATNENIENHPNDTILEYVKDSCIEVMACTEDGNIIWDNIEAVTRHPPINKDGTNVLIKIRTKSGREVIATKAKSFLKRIDNKILPINGDELKVGDYVPISKVFLETNKITEWNLDKYLSKKEYVYISELKKAVAESKKGVRHWFKGNTNFTVPYSRSDSVITNEKLGKGKNIYKDNCVYTKNTIKQPSHITETMVMDELFGFFIGAYLSEGCCTTHHILIANCDDDFNNKIDEFCKRYDLKYHIDDGYRNGGYTKTLRIHSMILAQLLLKSIGTGSKNKRIPEEFFEANTEFLKGLVDGYFSGDGTVGTDAKRKHLSMTSISRGLIDDMQQILCKFNIKTTIQSNHTGLAIALKAGMKASLSYTLMVCSAEIEKFKSAFNITIQYKQENINSKENLMEFGKLDTIPDIVTEQWGTITLNRKDISKYITKANETDKIILENILNEDIVYDRIEMIEEVISEYPFVYDLTVTKTKNFNIANGLCMRDTFHMSGVSSASQAVRGVPRIKELLSVSKNIKAPACSIYLKEGINKDVERAKKVLNALETTVLKDIVKSSRIYYDKSDTETTIEDDKLFMEMYKIFEDRENDCDKTVSPWLLRFEFDKEKMHDLGIDMLDVNITINKFYNNVLTCKFSDDNAEKLVVRIRINEEYDDMITELKALEQSIIENVIIKGISKINKVMMRKEKIMKLSSENIENMIKPNDIEKVDKFNQKIYDKTYNNDFKVFVNETELILDTDGTNLIEILGHDDVDETRTISNDIWEIYNIFGIEAARESLIYEINDVLKSEGVNFRHISLLVDTMTNRGHLLSIDRHGINRSDIGPLAKSSFEETSDMLIKAGIYSEYDRMNGVSACIMLGAIPNCGTGEVSCLMDESMLEGIDEVEEEDEDDEATDKINTFCTSEGLSFDVNMFTSKSNSVKTEPLKEFKITIGDN